MGRVDASASLPLAGIEVVGGSSPRRLEAQPSVGTADAELEGVVAACARIIAGLSEETDLDQLLRELARETCSLLEVARCSVYLREDGGDWFRGRVAHTGGEDDAAVRRLVAGVAADRFTREIVATLEPVLIEDAAHDPRPVRATMRAWGVRSMVGVPMLAHEKVVGLLFLDDCDRPLRMDEGKMRMARRIGELTGSVVAAATATSAARNALATETRGRHALGRVLALQRALLEDLVAGRDLEALAARVAALVKKPVCVFGAESELLAVGEPPQAATVRPFEPPQSIAAVEPHAAADAKQDGGAVAVGPLPEAGVMHRLMIAGVIDSEGREAGSVAIAEQNGRLAALEQLAARSFASVLAVRERAMRARLEADMEQRGALARDLLFSCGDQEALGSRALRHGIRFDGAVHVVAMVASCDLFSESPELGPESVRRALARVFPSDRIFVSGVDRAVLAVLALPDDGSPEDAVAVFESLADELSLGDSEVIAALARPCHRAGDFPRARRECERGVEALRSLDGRVRRRTITARDLGLVSVGGGSVSPHVMAQHAVDVLGDLVTPAGGELLQTLGAYLDNDRSARDAAECLGVHQNTVRYRLAGIAKTTKLDVAGSPEDEARARSALNVLRLRGLLQDHRPTASAPL